MSSVFKKLQKRGERVLNQELGLTEESEPTKRQKLESSSEDVSSDESVKPKTKQTTEQPGEIKEINEKDQLKAFTDQDPESKEWKNRQRVLITSQRGIEMKFRTLMDDFINLIPHSKKESKVERKNVKEQIDELCFERSCNNFIYFEQRHHKKSDLYIWFSKSPNGPAVKFLAKHVTTADELKLTGNCLKYSRPLLSFDGAFADVERPYLGLIKEMLSGAFNTPKNHPKSKPFIDHVLAFSYYENKVWIRNYQVLNQNEDQFTAEDDIEKLVLIEIGPRLCLDPVKIFDGSMGGKTLWQNQYYVAPTKSRSKKYESFLKKRLHKEKSKESRDKVLREGQDPDSYLFDAYEEVSDEEVSD